MTDDLKYDYLDKIKVDFRNGIVPDPRSIRRMICEIEALRGEYAHQKSLDWRLIAESRETLINHLEEQIAKLEKTVAGPK